MSGIIGRDPRGRSGVLNQFTDVGLNTSLDSEWHSSMNAVQINSGSLSAHDSYPHYVQLNANVIQKDSGEKRVNNSYKASQHRQWDGEHIFKVAPAASGDISWTTAMTINNSGNVGIGEATPNWKCEINRGNASDDFGLVMKAATDGANKWNGIGFGYDDGNDYVKGALIWYGVDGYNHGEFRF